MKKIFRAFKIINILSLDIAAGAMIGASFFARMFDVVILSQGLTSLGLTVWIIYTADHLLDAKKIRQSASTDRHRFHQQHFKVLLIAMIIAVVADATQIFFIRIAVLRSGLLLSSVVAIYFLVQQRLGFLKELLGTFLYTSGVLLIPISVRNNLPSHFILLVVQFGLTAWINLLLFSWIDLAQDEKDRHRSFVTTFGEGTTQIILLVLFSFSAMLVLVELYFYLPLGAILTMGLMNVVLLIVFLNKKYFEKEDRYRLVGDAIFLLPLLYILI